MPHPLKMPLIAILRGVTPKNCVEVAQTLISQGFEAIEVPLNSPNALESITLLVEQFGKNYLIGAGTVTNLTQARQVIETGANLIVSPNCNIEVIKAAVDAGCTVLPGVITPSEAFAALEAGATGLKIFPANVLGESGFAALMSVLPTQTQCFPVGGISANSEVMLPYLKLGASGFGIGAALFTNSMSIAQIERNAASFVTHYSKARLALTLEAV